MGDTGSLGLGGLIARRWPWPPAPMLLLPIIGVLFVIITVLGDHPDHLLQTTGKRVFRMSPLQHHFELAGWSEVNIVDPVLDHRRASASRSASACSTATSCG